jgi:hypothetical protein
MNLHQWVLMLTWYELLLGVLFLEVELDAKLVVLLVYYMLLLMMNILALWMIAVMKEPTRQPLFRCKKSWMKKCFFISLCKL